LVVLACSVVSFVVVDVVVVAAAAEGTFVVVYEDPAVVEQAFVVAVVVVPQTPAAVAAFEPLLQNKEMSANRIVFTTSAFSYMKLLQTLFQLQRCATVFPSDAQGYSF
jgi:hypothetical protein